MADDKIRAYDRHGEKITIDKSEVGRLYALGGKLATKAETSAHEVEQEYAQKSALEKIGGVAANAGPAGWIAGKAYTAATGKHLELPPEAEAYKAGIDKSTIIMPHVNKALAGVVGGDDAATQYVERQDKFVEASPVAAGLGEAVGTVAGSLVSGGVGAAGKLGTAAKFANPVAGAISAAGNLAERGVVSALGTGAGRGVLAKAGIAAAKMGAQGAVEGALYAGAQHASDELLHDRELSADKLFAATGTGALYGGLGGAALGAAGSLASSGLGAARDKIAGVLSRGEQAVDVGAAQTSALAPKALSTEQRLANEFAVDALGATKGQRAKILEHVAGKEASVGEYLNRVHLPTGEEGFLAGASKAAMKGRADEMLPAIAADQAGRVRGGLDNALRASPARVDMRAMMAQARESYDAMLKDPARVAGAQPFHDRLIMEMGALEKSGKVATDGTMDAVDAFFLRSNLAKQAYEVRKVSGAAGDTYKQWLRDFDKTTLGAIDKAAEAAGKSGVGDEIRYWKREWQLSEAAKQMAEHGTERVLGNNTFGIRESIGAAAGLASGNILGAGATLLGGKLLRERGSAVAAYAMNRLSQGQVLTKWVQRIDDQIGKASKGLLQPAQKGLVKASEQMPASKALTSTALARVAAFNADPEAFVEKATRQVESVSSHDAELANALVGRQVQAMTFLASKVPVTPDPDPLDPHPAPKMTPSEQAEFGRYAWYTEKPARFFSEVARGKITFEGAETAKALMPRAFAELQSQTEEHLATMMARGTKIPYRQRQYLGVLLDMAATPSQRPDHAAFLQKNVSSDDVPQPPPRKPLASAPKSHMSALDRLEMSGPGRRG